MFPDEAMGMGGGPKRLVASVAGGRIRHCYFRREPRAEVVALHV